MARKVERGRGLIDYARAGWDKVGAWSLTVTAQGVPSRVFCFTAFRRAGKLVGGARALSAERDVLALTLRGHLGSEPFTAGEAPTIQAWADAVEAQLVAAGFEQPDIAGNSLGGWLALELAQRAMVHFVGVRLRQRPGTLDEGHAIAKQSPRYRTVRTLLPAGASSAAHAAKDQPTLSTPANNAASIPPRRQRLVASPRTATRPPPGC